MFLYYWNASGFQRNSSIEFFCTLLCILSFVLVWSLTFHHLLFCKCFLLFLCSITLGGFGVDRFYLGLWREGIGKLFSFGGLGVWTIVDVILIAVGYIGPQDGSLYIWVGASSTIFFFFVAASICIWVGAFSPSSFSLSQNRYNTLTQTQWQNTVFSSACAACSEYWSGTLTVCAGMSVFSQV